MRSQGVTEELKCLSLLNALDKDQDIPDQLAQLFGEPCIKLAEGIKAYISKVGDNLWKKFILNVYLDVRVSQQLEMLSKWFGDFIKQVYEQQDLKRTIIDG